MRDQTYSSISRLLYLNLKDSLGSRSDFLRLVWISDNLIKGCNLEKARALHNRYIRLGESKYGMLEMKEHQAPLSIKDLESKFEKDPSDMSLVTRLAISYYAVGNVTRALQLFERVSASGYPARVEAVVELGRVGYFKAQK